MTHIKIGVVKVLGGPYAAEADDLLGTYAEGESQDAAVLACRTRALRSMADHLSSGTEAPAEAALVDALLPLSEEESTSGEGRIVQLSEGGGYVSRDDAGVYTTSAGLADRFTPEEAGALALTLGGVSEPAG